MLVLVLDTSTPAVTAALVEIAVAAPATNGDAPAAHGGGPAAATTPRPATVVGGGGPAERGGGPSAHGGGPAAGAVVAVGGAQRAGGGATGSRHLALNGAHGVMVRAERHVVDGRAHGELLAPQITAVLTEVGARPGDLTAIVAGLGPGPFTGLRVGLVTAVSMGQALAIPTYGVCSLDALGLAAGPGRVLAATDARRREVYWAIYHDGRRTDDPDVTKPADLAGPDGVTGAVDRAVGEGAVTYADVLRLPQDSTRRVGTGLTVDAGLLYPPAWALAALAADRVRAGAPGERLTPLYLRRPDAVEPSVRKPALP